MTDDTDSAQKWICVMFFQAWKDHPDHCTSVWFGRCWQDKECIDSGSGRSHCQLDHRVQEMVSIRLKKFFFVIWYIFIPTKGECSELAEIKLLLLSVCLCVCLF